MIRKLNILFALALVVSGVSVAVSQPAMAQSLPDVKALIIDFERVSTDSLVGQDVNAQISQQNTRITTWEANTAAQLNNERQELERQRTIIAPDAFEERAVAFQQRANAAQSQLQLLQENLRNVNGQAQLEIRRMLQPIVGAVMTERGGSIVFDKRVVWHSASGFDVTTAIIDRLNQDLPNYDLAFMALPEITAGQ